MDLPLLSIREILANALLGAGLTLAVFWLCGLGRALLGLGWSLLGVLPPF